MDEITIYNKTKLVISSCKTIAQLHVAYRYVEQAQKQVVSQYLIDKMKIRLRLQRAKLTGR